MITKTGSGASPAQSIFTSTAPKGFYGVGYTIEAAPGSLPPGAWLRLDVTTPQPSSAGVAVATATAPKAVGAIGNVYVEPGGGFGYQVTPIGLGSAPPPAWEVNFFLYAPTDIAS